MDFPRIPYPKDAAEFEHYRHYGNQLRELHLMHTQPSTTASFPIAGDCIVEQITWDADGSSAEKGTQTALSSEGKVVADTADEPSTSQIVFADEPSASQVGRVYINRTQYFDQVPQSAWEMFIGGYQPAQKWLKDRKGRALSFDDIQHYCRIIGILQDTQQIMQEIG